MKIVSYNIMSGGFSDYDSKAISPERLPLIQRVLQEIDADVVGLIDTYRWDKLYSLQQLQEMFGYSYVTCINLNDDRMGDNSNGLTLLSRQPWRSCKTVRIATRDALVVTFTVNDRDMAIALAYLDDLKEEVRLQQVRALLASSKVDIIMGDLNSIALVDAKRAAAALEDFYLANAPLRASLEPVISEMQQGRVISYLEAQGFTDAGEGAGCTMPTQLFPAVATKPFLRLDYCLHRPTVHVSDFTVHNTDTAKQASDHLPIGFMVA